MWLENCFKPFCQSMWGQGLSCRNDTLNDHIHIYICIHIYACIYRRILREWTHQFCVYQDLMFIDFLSLLIKVHDAKVSPLRFFSMLQVWGSRLRLYFSRSDKVQRDTFGFCILYLLKIKNRGRPASRAIEHDLFWLMARLEFLLYWGELWVICCGKAMNI